MKKIFLLAAAAVLAQSVLCSCGNKDYAVKEKLFSDWTAYLQFNEYLYGDMLWAIPYVEQFAEEPTWDNLQIARAAVCTAEVYTAVRNPQETTMTDKDYNVFAGKGYDVLFIPMEMDGWESEKFEVLNTYSELKLRLFDNVYYEQNLTDIPEYVEYLKQYFGINMRNVGLETNYILAVVDDSHWTERLEEFISENLSYLNMYRPELIRDPEAIENESMQELEKLEECIAQLKTFIGNSQVASDELNELFETNNIAALSETASEIDGVPAMLPNVSWNDIEGGKYHYFYGDDDKEHEYIKERETISKSPDGCMIEYSQVSKVDVLEYGNYLNSLGFECSVDEDDNGVVSVSYSQNGSSLSIIWSEEICFAYMTGEPVCFAPEWYIISQR